MSRDEQGKWLKGTSANPGGRPKGRGLKAEVERVLSEKVADGSNETRLQRIAKVIVSMAEQGDLRAAELIFKRLWPERSELKAEVSGDQMPRLVLTRNYTGRSDEAGLNPRQPPAQIPEGAVFVDTGIDVGAGENVGVPRLPAPSAPPNGNGR